MDKSNYTIVRTGAHKKGTLVTETSFLHNTKVDVSNYNESKAMNNEKNTPKDTELVYWK